MRASAPRLLLLGSLAEFLEASLMTQSQGLSPKSEVRSPRSDTMSVRMRSSPHPALVFAVILIAIFLLHAPLLRLPYFWDEAGYYVPAARDILLSGSLIPHTIPSNAHPPLVMAWLALW